MANGQNCATYQPYDLEQMDLYALVPTYVRGKEEENLPQKVIKIK